jgi:GTP cyclohydrolase II
VLLYVVNRNRVKLKTSFERLVARANVADLWKDRESTKPSVGGGAQTSEALRDFGLGAQVLADLGCNKIRLMMWSDRKIPGLEGFGIEVVERVPIPPPPSVKSAAKSQS